VEARGAEVLLIASKSGSSVITW
jgi:hypothetical protein